MEEQKLICIGCPKGCEITAVFDDAHKLQSLSGYSCPIGMNYAKEEFTAPKRTVTSTVATEGGKYALTPVKTKDAVPKEHIMDVMHAIAQLRPKAPIHVGDVLLKSIYGSDVVATGDNPEA